MYICVLILVFDNINLDKENNRIPSYLNDLFFINLDQGFLDIWKLNYD
jgi:hypothetical protein